MLAKILPAKPIAEAAEADAVLEIAYLMTAVDGRLGEEELEAYREIVGAVRGTKVKDADIDALLDRFAGNVETAEIAERAKALAPRLSAASKDLAFKLAVALSLVDLDASRDEEDLTDLLAEALGIDDEKRDQLTGDVMAAFDAGTD